MKHIIVGTAGHIDHGKTTLVKALTGIDADRLKEEKQRGITIDIGFADLAIGDYRFGFVDVPGHERFVKNMLAGVHGIDMVMLVIAADESVMPQTREHFDICRLLQVKSGLVALTKADLVDEELLDLARSEVEDFVRGSFLEGAPILAVSSRSGDGMEQMKTALADLASQVLPKPTSSIMRLPIDRVFSIKGFGTVVTGTLITGMLAVGDDVEVLPASRRTRVRNLQVHSQKTDSALAGQRTAVNLQGVGVEEVQRGSVLVQVGKLCATSMIDVRLDLLASASHPLSHRARVRLHHGTAEILARVAFFGDPQIEGSSNPTASRAPEQVSAKTTSRDIVQSYELQPGASRIVQLRLEEPITTLPGDRFIIRSYSPMTTIGGGVVIDALPEKHRLRDKVAYTRLEKLEKADPVEGARIYIEMRSARAVTASELSARMGMSDEQITTVAKELTSQGEILAVSNAPLILISAESYHLLTEQVTGLLRLHHQKEPLLWGLSREEVRERIFGALRPEIFRSAITQLVDDGKIIAERDLLRLATFRPELSNVEENAKQTLEGALRSHGLQATTLEEAIAEINISADLARKLFNLLAAEQQVIRIGEFVFHSEPIEDLKSRVRAQKSVSPKMDVAVFKELTGGLTRKHAIPLLEFLDRERITRRIGNDREII
jgi:selenocysteine-specific elongation factor